MGATRSRSAKKTSTEESKKPISKKRSRSMGRKKVSATTTSSRSATRRAPFACPRRGRSKSRNARSKSTRRRQRSREREETAVSSKRTNASTSSKEKESLLLLGSDGRANCGIQWSAVLWLEFLYREPRQYGWGSRPITVRGRLHVDAHTRGYWITTHFSCL